MREFVLNEAKENIKRVKGDKEYIGQAKQVNASLGKLVAMDRNKVMNDAIALQKTKVNLLENAD